MCLEHRFEAGTQGEKPYDQGLTGATGWLYTKTSGNAEAFDEPGRSSSAG